MFNIPTQIEYTLITLDKDQKKAQLSLIGPNILDGLQQPESNDPLHHKSKWRPEYAAYMIEGPPNYNTIIMIPQVALNRYLPTMEANRFLQVIRTSPIQPL